MERLSVITAVTLFLGLTPALAQTAPSPANTTDVAPAPVQPQEALPEQIRPDVSAAPSVAIPGPSASLANEQKNDEWLASNLIGKSVENARNETIGEISDLVADQNGKIVAALIHVGGFIGIWQGRRGRLRGSETRARRHHNAKVLLELDQQTLASAPVYQEAR